MQRIDEQGQGAWERLRQESFELMAEATADRPGQMVRNVVLLGPQSKNGYRYSSEAMEQAAPLYESRPVFLDHAEGTGTPTRRKLRDFAGQVMGPRLEGDRLRGDLRLMGPHTQWLFDLMEAAPRDIGMSHVVLGRRGHDGQCVEQIQRVISVDIVAFPATTSSFRESTEDVEEVREMLARSGIPAQWHDEALVRAVLAHPEPGRLLSALEQFVEKARGEEAVSAGKRGVGDRMVSTKLKRALVRAFRGEALAG